MCNPWKHSQCFWEMKISEITKEMDKTWLLQISAVVTSMLSRKGGDPSARNFMIINEQRSRKSDTALETVSMSSCTLWHGWTSFEKLKLLRVHFHYSYLYRSWNWPFWGPGLKGVIGNMAKRMWHNMARSATVLGNISVSQQTLYSMDTMAWMNKLWKVTIAHQRQG